MTNDLRIADAPLLVDVSGEEKLPTGGYGNYSTTINQIADFTQLKWKLATEGYVNNEISVVTNKLNNHTQDKTNPHKVTKEQVGLGEVDNTADLDKPVSAYQRTAIDEKVAKTSIVDNLTTNESNKVLSAKQGKVLQDTKANKTDVNEALDLKADKSEVYNKDEVYTKDETLTLEREDKYLRTWSGRTQRDKNKEFASAVDFGLVGDSITDNTVSLTVAINHYNTTKTRVYLPDTGLYYRTTNTSYPDEIIRSAFYGGGKIRQVGVNKLDNNRTAVRTTKAECYTSESSGITQSIDFQVKNSFAIGTFKRIGQSPNNAMQGFVYDQNTNEYFSYHVSTTVSGDSGVEYGVLNRYSTLETNVKEFQSLQSSTPQKITGHQGLSLAYTDSGVRKFFASLHASQNAKAGAFIVSFEWESSSNDLKNMQTIQVFDDSKTTSATTLPSVSPDGRYLVVKRNESPASSENGQGSYRIRVFDLQKMLRSELLDWSNDFLHEFTVESFDLIGSVRSFQGLAVGFNTITCLFGNSVRDEPCYLLSYTLDGRLINVDANNRIGMAEAQADDPESPYEPEAIQYVYYNGLPALFTFVTSGLSGARIARLMCSSAKLTSQKGFQYINNDIYGGCNLVDLANNGYFLHGRRRGLDKLKLYTSASQTRIEAHTGNLLALSVAKTENNLENFEWRISPSSGNLYPSVSDLQNIGAPDRFSLGIYCRKYYLTPTVFMTAQEGSPEGVLTGGIGSQCTDTLSGDFYCKKSGTGNTGWVKIG